MVSLADFRLRCISGVVRNSCCFRTAWWRNVLPAYPNDSNTCCSDLWDSCLHYRPHQHRKKERAVYRRLFGGHLWPCRSSFLARCDYLPSLENRRHNRKSRALLYSLVAVVGFDNPSLGQGIKLTKRDVEDPAKLE